MADENPFVKDVKAYVVNYVYDRAVDFVGDRFLRTCTKTYEIL